MSLESLTREVGRGAIETVVTALPDLYGRLVGKRIHAPFFLEEIVSGGMQNVDGTLLVVLNK